MIPLICIDVDGTLVGSSGVVTEGVWEAVDRALARGQHLALSTARGAFASSWEMAQRLDPAGWHVFHAGGATVHTGTGDSRGHPLSSEQIEISIGLAAESGWVLEVYSTDDYAVAVENHLSVVHAELLGTPFAVSELESFISSVEQVVRVQFVVPESAVPQVNQALESADLTVTTATSPIMPGAAFVSATKSGVTKATGIAEICGDLDISIDQVMMIGDGHNDLPAMEAVGYPVAMGNAAPEVEALARYHVASVHEDGVAEALDLSATL